MGRRYRGYFSGILLCAVLVTHSSQAGADRPVQRTPPRAQAAQQRRICSTPISAARHVPRELARPSTLILSQLSLLSPILIGQTGADHELRVFAQTSLGGSYNAEPVSLAAPYVTIGVTALAYGAYA